MKIVSLKMIHRHKEEEKIGNLESLMRNMNKANEESWGRVLIELNEKSAENTEK